MIKRNTFVKVAVGITYLTMVIVNALANILPINGVNTGQVSDAYPNLFAPAPITFSIWGVIYFLLAAYTLYQFGFFQKNKDKKTNELLEKIGIFFIISSLANILWIFSWHYNLIGITLFFMAAILYSLIKIADLLNKERFTSEKKFFIAAPFSIYFGWITVATIANITTFLVSIGWNGFGVSDDVWTVIILLIGATIGIIRTLKDNNIFYGSVLVWAYIGIFIKHTSIDGFAGQYKSIITTVLICLILFLITNGFLLFKKDNLK